MRYKLIKIINSNWLWCSVLTAGIIASMLFHFYPMEFLEYKAFDLLAGLRKRNEPNPIAIVEIDEKSVREMGSRSWPRSYTAKVISKISEGKPRVMGIHLLYTGPEINPGLAEVQELRREIRRDPFLKKRKSRYKFDQMLAQTEESLNHDGALVASVNFALNVILPIHFTTGTSGTLANPRAQDDWISRRAIDAKIFGGQARTSSKQELILTQAGGASSAKAVSMVSTFEELARKAGALGHINVTVDRDGSVRKTPLLIRYGDRLYPSFALQAAAKYSNARLEDLQPGDSGLKLKNLDIPTDDQFNMLIDFRGRQGKFQRVSFTDVFHDKVSPEFFKDKIVLLGETASWLTPSYRTVSPSGLSDLEITANAVENIINRKHFSRPVWAFVLEILVAVYFGLFLLFVIPRVRPRDGALILSIFLITWICFTTVLLMVFGYWLKTFAPIILTTLGFAVAGFHRYASEKQHDTVELNKLMGLSFQAKGMLDMAFEKFTRCPVDNDSVRELLYNLGQDFERKRMFYKALAVYNHLLKAGRYRDVQRRVDTLETIGESANVVAPKSNGSIILEAGTIKPTLGRYEILKELGQGAMGTVYLGRDPKINREVAIKTLSFSNVDEDMLEEVKERFLREAEAAGRLSHPNIVTIFDVGEEHDMAYMAMELLKGDALSENCQKGRLLGVPRVLAIVSSVAEALHYAHGHDVVHRDIKPDNIMLLEDNQVKVADFGIARVMSTSQTQTGVILGTPNYMSPEQVEGLPVDGRSDLFSLGVVMYEMLSGQRPFSGDNMAHLMFNISNASYTPLASVAPKVPPCCTQIVAKLLSKDREKRYKSADTLIKSLQQCRENL